MNKAQLLCPPQRPGFFLLNSPITTATDGQTWRFSDAVREYGSSQGFYDGISRAAVTGSFGYFRFDSVQTGETYVVSVVAKGYQFAPQAVTVNEELSELSFTALQ